MYLARIDEDKLTELIKTGYFIEGRGYDRDKPIKVLYTGNNKPVLCFNEDALKLFKELKIVSGPIPVGCEDIRAVMSLLEKDNIEALMN